MLKCTTAKLAETIWPLVKADIPVLIHGKTGIGKSQVVREELMPMVAKEFGTSRLHDYRLSSKDIVDGTGIPDVDKEARATYWTRPAFIPEEDGNMHVIFLDEFGHAMIPMQHAVGYPLVLDRMLGEFRLPRLNRILLATNTMDDKGGDNKILKPLEGRMAHVEVLPDHKSWCSGYAVDKGLDPRLIAFIRLRPELFHRMDLNNPAWPLPRKHEWLDRILKNETNMKIIERCTVALCGDGFAAQFIAFLENLAANLPRLQDIKADPKKAKVPSDLQHQYVVAAAIVPHVTAKDAHIWAVYLGRLEADIASSAAHSAQKAIGNHPALQDLII